MNKIMMILNLIPSKLLIKYLPKILSNILIKALRYSYKKEPEKYLKTIKETEDIIIAMQLTVNSAKDGIITEDDIIKCQRSWEEAFKFK